MTDHLKCKPLWNGIEWLALLSQSSIYIIDKCTSILECLYAYCHSQTTTKVPTRLGCFDVTAILSLIEVEVNVSWIGLTSSVD